MVGGQAGCKHTGEQLVPRNVESMAGATVWPHSESHQGQLGSLGKY